MEEPLDIKLQQEKDHRKEILEKIRGPTPARGKTIKIKKKKRDPSVDELIEKTTVSESIPDDKPVINGRLNEKLINLLDELAKFMVKRGEPFRARAYQKAQESIITHPNEINPGNYQQLISLPGVGETIVKKIKEYIQTGTLRLLERERADPKNIFSDIYGIGPKKAVDLVNKGITSIEQLREKQDELLNNVQKMGLTHYEDILKRIPRKEVEEYKSVFEKLFDEIKEVDSQFEIVGSFRRGAKTSGDIDVIVTSENRNVFKKFIDKLVEEKIIVELLSRGNTKSLVVAKLPSSDTVRRVDFMYTSKEEYPFAILYFTGSKIFNTVMRGRALIMGYSLNEHGLYKMDGKKKGGKLDKIFDSEEAIFKFLEMEYKEPNQRIDGRSVVPLDKSLKNEIVEPIVIQDTIQPIQSDNNDVFEPIMKETKIKKKELAKEEKKELREKIQETKKKEKEDIKLMKLKEKNDEKTRKKREKEENKKVKEQEKTRKKREKEEEKEKKKKAKEEEKTRKKREKDNKIENKLKKKNVTKKNMPLKKKLIIKDNICPICKTNPLNLHNNDPTLHAIEHFKTGGVSVLDNLSEKTLNAMLIKTNEVYRNLGPNEQPLVSDNQYDILEDYIKEKYPKSNIIGKIGAPVEKNKIKLPYEMASMDKIKPDTKALPSWKSKYNGPYVLSCKLDGVSGLYTTENDSFGLYTRGDGKVGQDVSHFLTYLKLPKDKDIVVRGEFIMAKKTFETKYSSKFANARNLIAGTVNRVSINDTVNDMDFVAYEMIKPVLKPSEQMAKLQELGFNVVRNETHENINNDELSKILVDWRDNYDYEIDGVIVTNDEIYSRKSGNPDHSFAFKMALSDQMAETKVLDIEWNASKDGYLKPIVHIEPIKLSGVTIKKATGFNGAFIESNKIGVGAIIQIIRSGDVIPYIRNVITPAEQPLMPTVDYIWNDSHVDIMLENKNDDENVRNKNIVGFFKGIEVDGLGEKNVVKMVDAGYDSVPKILAMTKEQILSIDGFKEKMAEKLHSGISEKTKNASLAKLMSVSNMFGRGFSDKKIELILNEYPNILSSTEDEETKVKKLKDIKGMALKTAQAFVKEIPQFIGFLQQCKLESKLVINQTQQNIVLDESHPLYKKSVVMSGTRDKELDKKLKDVGASLSTSVTSKTFCVITPDPESDTGKVANAKKLNIPLYTPEAFKEKYRL
jgi:DNA ligase (NAD+)